MMRCLSGYHCEITGYKGIIIHPRQRGVGWGSVVKYRPIETLNTEVCDPPAQDGGRGGGGVHRIKNYKC